jgi:hypothetical protein
VASGSFQHVVELSLLEALRPELLFALLRPYEQALAAFGIVVDRSEYSSAWLLRLHSVLNRDDAALPAPLQSALIDIADLSTEAGGDLIITEARRSGVELFGGKIPAQQDLAVAAYLSHPELFRAAHRRLHVSRRTTFEDFYGTGSARPLAGRFDRQRAALRKRLKSAFLSRHRPGCRVLIDDRDGEMVLFVAHGGLPHRGALIRGRQRRELRTYVVETHDVIIYDKVADRLSIDAAISADVDVYRAVMGYLVAIDDDYFQPFPAFRADPFKKRGSAALDVRGIAGIEKVVLLAATLLGRDRSELVQALASNDLGPWLDEAFRAGTLEHLVFGAWTLGVVTPLLGVPLEVEIRPPNQLRFDPRVPIGPLRRFLKDAGLEVLPPRGGRRRQ